MPQAVLKIGDRELEVLKVSVYIPVCGCDEVHLSLTPDTFIEVVGKQLAEMAWGNQFCMVFRTPHGKGQTLCEKLGLVPDKVQEEIRS